MLLGACDATLGEAAAATLKAEGLDVRFTHINLGKPTTTQAAGAAAEIEAEHGRLDVLVSNARITDRADGLPGTASVDPVPIALVAWSLCRA